MAGTRGSATKDDVAARNGVAEARDTLEAGDKFVYGAAALSALFMLIAIPAQVLVFALVPLPEGIGEWFALFGRSRILGFLHADILILADNVMVAVVYLAFYRLLGPRHRGPMQLALLLGGIGIAGYLSSNRAFELDRLALQWAQASGEAERTAISGAGLAMLAGWQGTAFDAYYVLNGIALAIIAWCLILDAKSGNEKSGNAKSGEVKSVEAAPGLGIRTAWLGMASAILMMVPSTAGAVGLVFSLLSLVPWYLFTIRFGRAFLRMARRIG